VRDWWHVKKLIHFGLSKNVDSRKKGSPTQWIPWILFTEKTSIKIVSCGDGLHMANLKFHFIFNVQQAPACSTNFSKNCDHLANAGKF
jgi:hypothetical protein